MFGLGLGLLALFSLFSLFADHEDPRRGDDPQDDLGPLLRGWRR